MEDGITMKKFISILLLCAIIFSACACGNKVAQTETKDEVGTNLTESGKQTTKESNQAEAQGKRIIKPMARGIVQNLKSST